MIVKASDQRAAGYAALYCEGIGILIIAYAFLTPLPLWSELLIAGGVTYLAMTRGALVSQGEITRDEGLQRVWHIHLMLRFGIDAALQQVRGGRPPSIDWGEALQAATADIKDAHEQEKFERQMGQGLWFELVLYGVGAMVLIPIRGLIGFGIAWSLMRFSPVTANWLVTG